MTICYGMTETSPVSTQTRTDDTFENKVSTVGRCRPHVEIKIVDPSPGDPCREGSPASSALRATR
jgi:fatty-acyl-CoA synthase